MFACRTKKKQQNTQIKNSTSTNYGATYCFSRPPTRYLYEALPAGRATRLAIGWPGRLLQRTIKEVAGRARARAKIARSVCLCDCVCVRSVQASCGKVIRRMNSMSKISLFRTCERVWSALLRLSSMFAPRTVVLAERPWLGLDIPRRCSQGPVFRSFLAWTVISCLVFVWSYLKKKKKKMPVRLADLRFLHVMYRYSRTEKKNWKKKKSL